MMSGSCKFRFGLLLNRSLCRQIGVSRRCNASNRQKGKNGNSSDNGFIGSSTLLVQDGINIKELPIIVRKVRDLPDNFNTIASRSVCDVKGSISGEEKAITEGLLRCSGLAEIFRLLETIPATEVTANVAANALHCIATLKHREFRNFKIESDVRTNVDSGKSTETFAWSAILTRLCDTITTSGCADFGVALQALKAVHRGQLCTTFDEPGGVSLQDKLVSECLLQAADNLGNVAQLIDFVLLLHTLQPDGVYAKEAEKLWTAIAAEFKNINETNIASIYSVLPLFKKSQALLLNLLIKRTFNCWWKLKCDDVVAIIAALVAVDHRATTTAPLMAALTKWLHLNIHQVSEFQLSKILQNLTKMRFFDENIAKAVVRYVKVRNVHLKDYELAANIADACLAFRFSSPDVLNTLAAIFVANHDRLSSAQVIRIAKIFGLLSHPPLNAAMFFARLEETLTVNFGQFKASDLIELLLSCTYIQRFPLNFVHLIFNPFFLDRLNNIQDERELRRVKANLKLLDTTMTLECPQYPGPLLAKDKSPKSIIRDHRLIRLRSTMEEDLTKLLGGRNNFSYSHYVWSGVPLQEIYIADYAWNVNSDDEPLPFEQKIGITKRKLIIINFPEHYTIGANKNLIGQQATRIRHLRILGYEVIRLDFEILEKWRLFDDERLTYIKSKLLSKQS